ncbi:kinase-like domain-containing protein [Phycomyces blakesleeanus]|uniref:Protein kinase domain-containing protein n=2 Tax=Phycomyces blakesleeanus TaxID=4837 RepID=A0A162UMU9_PHYB8|nr:hypothetical protein PHYBLDRAFT_59967 [Phycomyces blakesleeanus NRRL 1555(-)]OAD76433.1 hypothetical protein PHYBLDRAFT_59967 [Phycomyces blakesleeanus NRRL 1555(-)]|eukprot:XP_018294473.1 hypothetical protein PHYBLDRAFT_59967 [Phycomyces blakesleeanus NRRL 1555(-)]
MNHASLNRLHPDHHYQEEIVKTDLVSQTIQDIHNLIAAYPLEFHVPFLTAFAQPCTVHTAILDLYSITLEKYSLRDIHFDTHWHWHIAWRQALSYENLLVLGDNNVSRVVESFHPKSHKAIEAIYKHELARYMRWYPWKWFSNLVFIGAGGFSAVYEAEVGLPYDVSVGISDDGRGYAQGTHIRPVVLKVVDEKVLNEIVVQSRAFLALLFHGLTVCESTGDLMMVGTLAEQGNLENFIGRPIPFSMPAVLYAVTRLAVNMASLHDEIKMCHRNVHPRNVLCGDDYHLVDYRFSTASNEATKVTQQAMVHYGRIPYIAPEVRQGIYTEKSDVYSLGIMMWQLISGINFPDPEILLSNTNVYRIERIPGVPRWYQDLIIACLEPHPNNRPTSEEVGNITRRFADSESDARISPEWMAYVVRRRDEIKRSHQGVAKNQASVPVSRVYPLRQLQNPLPIHSSFLNRPLDMASFSALSSLT